MSDRLLVRSMTLESDGVLSVSWSTRRVASCRPGSPARTWTCT